MLYLSTATFSLMPFGVLRESDDVDSEEDCGNHVVMGVEEQHPLKKIRNAGSDDLYHVLL